MPAIENLTDQQKAIVRNGIDALSRNEIVSLEYATVLELAAATEQSRGVGSIWKAANYCYVEQAADATNHHITTVGGVKLRYIPDGGATYHVDALDDGSRTDRELLQFVIDLARKINTTGTSNSLSGTVLLPARTLLIDGSILLEPENSNGSRQLRGLIIKGQGRISSLNFSGNETTAIEVRFAEHVEFRDFSMVITGTYTNGFYTVASGLTKSCKWEKLSLSSTGSLYRAFLFGPGPDEPNNDFHVISNCRIQNYTHTGIEVQSSQSYGIKIDKTLLLANEGGMYGLKLDGGTCVMTGGAFARHNGNQVWGGSGIIAADPDVSCDIRVGSRLRSLIVDCVRSENSHRFFVSYGINVNQNVTLRNNSFAANQLASDQYICVLKSQGPLVLEGNVFGYSNTPDCKIYVEPQSQLFQSGVSIRGNNFRGNGVGQIQSVLETKGNVIVDWAGNLFNGRTYSGESVTANTNNQSGSTIASWMKVVTVSGVTNDSNDWINLPRLAQVENGHQIIVICAAGSNFEVRTPANSNEAINGVDSDGSNEYSAIDGDTIIFRKVNSANWTAQSIDSTGAIRVAVIPD